MDECHGSDGVEGSDINLFVDGAAGLTYVDECHRPDDVDGSDMCLFGDEFSGRSDNYILLRMSCIARMV